MNLKLTRLRVAALCALACVVSTAYVDGGVLSWEAPIQNADNSPLTNVCGYFLYEGASPDTMVRVAFAYAPALTLWLPNLGESTECLAMTTLNNDGIESAKSPILIVTGDLAP
jgi:hypothetical protein